jgi:hypothetical protein
MLCYSGRPSINKKGIKVMFDNVINEEAIKDLTPEQIELLLEMMEKAGY